MKKIFVTIICFTICIFTVSAINNEFRLDVNKILKDSSRTTAIADKMNTSYKIDYKVNKEENNEEYINLTKKTTFLLLGDGNISDETAYNYIQRKTEYGSLRYDPEIPKDENSFSGYDEDSKEYSDSLVAGITVPGMFNMLNSMNIYYDYLGDVKIIKQEDGFLSRIVLEGVKIDFSDPENPRKFKTEDTNLIIYYIFKEYKGEYKLYYLMAETNDTLDEYLEQVSKNENNNILSSKIPNISDISKLYDYSKLSSLTNKDLTNIYNTNINKTMLLSTYYDKSIITSATGFMLTNDILVTSWNYLKESLINGQFILIKDKNGNVYELEGVLTFDEVSEIALLKIKGYKGEGVTLGDSNLNKEDAVIALTTSTGMGITSQTGIVVNTSDYIQSLIPIKDTGIGSPLINAKGEVVGMNNSKALNSVISYATKVDCLKKIKEELMKTPNVKVTSFDKLKEEYYYQRSNTEKQKNNIPSKVWNEYKKIGNIEDNIFLPLIKASYKENVLSLRYKNEINNFMNSNNFSSLFEKALKEEKYNLIFDSNTKRIYENNKYKVVIMNEFDYLIVVMVKKMKKVLDENIKKIAIGLLIILIVAIIVLIVINKNDKIKIKEFKNNIYTIKYDNSWSINKSNEKDLLLKHSNNGIITINVEELEEPYKYETLNTLIDDIVFGIEKQNKDYLLLGQEKLKLTKKELDGYKLLYEKGDKQVLVIIIKQSDKLITYIYEADYEYFDILLDSAQSILYNFELNNEKIDLTTDVFKIENQNIVWKGKDKVNKTQKYRLNDEHYTVDYEIPSEYSMYEFDEKLGIYYYDNDIDKSLTTNIRNLNMYEEISKNVLYDIENIKKNNSNVKVETTKGKLKDSYIYRVTYDYKNDYTEKNVKNEIVYYLIPLDNYHTFIFKLEHEDNYISEAIINSLKIKKLSKYSKNIDRNYEGNYIVNYMKIFKDRDRTNYYDIKLLTPPKWQELDNTNNRYQYRYFGLNYIEKKAEYEINASYKFAYNNTFDFATTLYKNKNLKVISTEHKNYNNKEFDIERFTYMEQKSTNYGVAIVYKISDDYWLDITIVSPKNNINDTMLKELTNFTIEEKEYK